MLSRWLAPGALATLFCISVSAAEKPQTWIEFRSPHFTVISDAGAKQARKAAVHFEQMRAVIQTALPKARVDPGEPVIILAAKNENDLKALLPAFWESKGHVHPAGIFVPGPEKNYVALRLDAEGDNPYQTVNHEYVHLLERLNFDRMPLWLSEGLAEFYGNTRIEEKEVGLGHAIPYDLEFLQSNRKIPLQALLTADHSSPFYNEAKKASAFYAQSWELTHYFYMGNKGAHMALLLKYCELIEQHVADLEAAQRAFGDLKQLQKELDQYSSQSAYYFYRLKAPFTVRDQDFTVRELAPAESAAVRGDFHVYMNRPIEARALLEEALRLDPKLASAHESMGFLAYREGDGEAALQWFSQAVQLDSKSYLAHYFQAMLSAQGLLTPEKIAAVEEGLRRTIQLNPNFAPAYATLAQFDALHEQKLDEGLELARKAVALEPGVLQYQLALANVLLRMGKVRDAQILGQRVLGSASSPQERAAAQTFLENLKQYQSYLAQKLLAEEKARQAQTLSPTGTGNGGWESGSPGPQQRAGPETSGAASPATTWGEGRITKVTCDGKTLTLSLDLYGLTMKLHSADYSKISYPSTQWHPPAGFDPCVGLGGKNVKVEYRVVEGQPYAGEILAVTVQR